MSLFIIDGIKLILYAACSALITTYIYWQNYYNRLQIWNCFFALLCSKMCIN